MLLDFLLYMLPEIIAIQVIQFPADVEDQSSAQQFLDKYGNLVQSINRSYSEFEFPPDVK
jgi:hypothetical protein